MNGGAKNDLRRGETMELQVFECPARCACAFIAWCLSAACVGAAFFPPICRAAGPPGATRVTNTQAGVRALLGDAALAAHARVVAEVPSGVLAALSGRHAQRGRLSLSQVAARLNADLVQSGGITVLRSCVPPPLSNAKARYRDAMHGAAEFIEDLTKAQRGAIDREQWLDLSGLQPLQQARAAAPGAFAGQPPLPPARSDERVAAGFVFDPYIQIRSVSGRSPRLFFRSAYRIRQYLCLMPAAIPGCLEAESARESKP